MKTDAQNLFRAAIVGAASLKGKELKEVLEERNFPAIDIRLLDDNESLGQLERVQDEVAFVQPVTRDQLEDVDFTFFASGEQFTRDHWKLALDAGAAVIDLSYALENEPGIPVSAPLIERELGQRAQLNLDAHTVAIAHPAAITLALLLLRASRAAQLSTATATIFEPVSEQGRSGMDELHEQTVNLLSFQQLPKGVFDSQVAFNMIGRFGPESGTTLESIERRIAAHLRKLTAGRVLDPAITLLQAPVFHAHTFSVFLEFAKAISDGDLSSALAGEQVVLARAPEESPSNVNVAGKNEILVSLRRDLARANGFWLWVAVDNLRLAALTAVDCAAALATVRPHGKVQ